MTEELKAEAKELGIEEEIVFVGKVPNEELNCYLQACDAFLFTSKIRDTGDRACGSICGGTSGCGCGGVRRGGHCGKRREWIPYSGRRRDLDRQDFGNVR